MAAAQHEIPPPLFSDDQHAKLRAAWAQVTVSELLKAHWKSPDKPAVVVVDAAMTAEEAFDVLVQNQINAAPVFDSQAQEYVGMVSMLDVVEFVVQLVKANKQAWQALDAELAAQSGPTDLRRAAHANSPGGPGIAGPEPNPTGIKLQDIAQRVRELKPIPVSSISDLARRDPFVALPADATLDKAMDYFGKGIHRIVVTEQGHPDNKKLVGILTQSDVVRFASEKVGDAAFDAVLRMKLHELRLSAPKPIVLVRAYQTVLEALQAMHTHRVSSVAVVDPSERLLGNISASDVKHIMRHLRYGVLLETCSAFIGGVKTRHMLENAGKDIVPVIQVAPTSVLAQVLRLLVVTKVHRVWVTEQNSHAANFQAPVAVVSLTDILRVLM